MVYVMSQNELYHHGILGMKWGKRQGPPYPLDGKQHSAAEKKAGWQKSLDKAHGALKKDAYKQKRSGSTARKIQKALNATDQAVVKGIYNKNVAEYQKLKALSLDKKADVSKYNEQIKEATKIIKEGEAATWKLLADSSIGGYNVNSKKVLKYVHDEDIRFVAIMQAVGGWPFSIGSAASIATARAIDRKFRTGTQDVGEGNRFKVKKSKSDYGAKGSLNIDQGRANGYEAIEDYNRRRRDELRNKAEKKRLVDKYRRESSEMKLKDKPATTQVEKDRAMINEAKANSKTLSSQVSKELTKDLIRWNKQGKDNYMKGKNAADVQKALEKEINEKIIKTANGPYMFSNKATTGKPTVKFQIDGLKNYSDGAPLEIEFDPQTKKVTYIGYV